MKPWKDVTSYSRGGDRTPRCWQMPDVPASFVVVYGHKYYPDKWVLRAPDGIPLDMKVLRATTAQEAQTEAVKIVCDWLRMLLGKVEEVAK